MTTQHTIVVLDSDTLGHDITWPDFSAFGEIKLYPTSTKEEALERVKEATIILTNKVVLTKEIISAAPNLKMISTLATGYNQVDIEEAAARGIPVCNIPDYSTPAVAQHTFALILELAAGLCAHAQAVRDGEWARRGSFCFWDKQMFELDGKSLGIVGFGNTGRAVAALGHSFGMKIIAYAPRPKDAPAYKPFSFVSQEELFATADVISLHCPLTPENTNMVNSKVLASMKKNALLINCSRGPLIDIDALVEALKNGTIAGAGLDVVPAEPMPANSPLQTAPNCIVTPHIAWASIEARTRLLNMTVDNIKAFVEGRPINVKNGVTA